MKKITLRKSTSQARKWIHVCVFVFCALFSFFAVQAADRLYRIEPVNDQENEIDQDVFGGYQMNEPRDVFGTKVGTSTSPVSSIGTAGYSSDWPNSDFSDMALNEAKYPTTSRALELSGMTKSVLFTFKTLTASTSAFFSYDIFGSNDQNCSTTATSTADANYDARGTIAIKEEINWFDVGSAGTRVSGSSDSLSVATGSARLLTDIAWRCLKVDLRGASSTWWVQMTEITN